jgi:multidrug efflux system membrane fusion protein
MTARETTWPATRRVRARLAAVLAFTVLVAACGNGGGNAGRAGSEPVPVRVGKVISGELPTVIEGVGTVVPITSVAIKARVDGQIERVAVRDGAEVHKGDVLFQLDRRPFQVALDAARANLESDEAQLAKARDQLRRFKDVFAKGYVSADQLEDAQANERSAAATVEAAKAAVEGASLDLEFATLRSPIDGRVGRITLQVGNMVKALDSTSLTTVNQMEPVYVEFSVPEQYLAEVRKAAEEPDTTVELTAAGDSGATLARHGRLTFLDNTVDQPTGTIRLRATLANQGRALWPGQFTRVKIRVPAEAPALMVPAAAVGHSSDGPFVYVVGPGSIAERRPVTLGRMDAEYAVVTSGVKEGEHVVVDGQSRVVPGGKVTEVTAKASQAGA